MEISIMGEGRLCAVLKPLPLQLRRVMRLTALLLFVGCLHVSARSYSQTVSFSGKDVPLQAVFTSIEKQTGLSFFFNYALMKNAKPVTINVQGATLEEILNTVLKGQGLDYYVEGKTVFIVKKEKVSGVQDYIDTTTGREVNVKGRITNLQGEALAGATIAEKKGRRATLSDERGMFELKRIPAATLLEVSYAGYEKKDIRIDDGGWITVELTLSNNQLDQMQVIAYGNTIQRLSTGNVTMIKAPDIEKQPVSNPLLALEGRVPGLFITQENGIAGGGVQVRLQGQNSIGSGNDPLYVIDGVPYVSQMLATTGGGTANILGTSNGPQGSGSGNPLNYINPGDIESIAVLKDADATAIYGSRAANGAILITTKKGKSGKTKTVVNLQNGLGKVTRMLDLMKTTEYLQMRHEAINNDGSSTSSTDYDINGLWDTTRYTDWQKTLIGGTSHYTTLIGNISGGSESTTFLINGTYRRESTVFPGQFSDQKGSLHFNLNNKSDDNKLHLQFSGSYLIDDNRLPGIDLTTTAIQLAPDAPKLFGAGGGLNWEPDSTGASSWTNPLSYLYLSYQNRTNNLISNAVLSYNILPELEVKTSFGYTNLQTNEFEGVPLIAVAPEARPFSQRQAYYTMSDINSWIIEPQVKYKSNVIKGKLDVLIGATIQQNNSNGQSLVGSGYNSDAVLNDIHSAATVTVNSSVQSVYKYDALFGRISYNLLDRYIIDLNARRDGSSRFGANNEFHNFSSIGASWIFSEENGVKDLFPFLSFGKIKGSFGTTGNDQIGDYKYLSLYNPTTAAVPYQGVTGLSPSGLPNPYLEWEETRKFQTGLDLGFLHDKILISAYYVNNHSSNQLLTYSLPTTTGFTGIIDNFPATVRNTDWEIMINTTNIKTKNLTWTSSLNFTIPKNELVKFPNLASSSYAYSLIIGQPISIQKVFKFAGVNDTTGVYQFYDSHGNVTYSPDPVNDNNVVINTLPKIYGGFENTIIYKSFQLDVFFHFVKQVGANYYLGAFLPPGYANMNQPVSVLSRWQKPGDVTQIERYNADLSLFTAYNYAYTSSIAYSDASYIRLKNLSLSYELPQGWQKKARLQNCRIYVQGQNLITITKYRGLDPENQNVTALPPLKVLVVGLQFGL
jgi:TonB-linked SusC/RagA family outer membrane protein